MEIKPKIDSYAASNTETTNSSIAAKSEQRLGLSGTQSL